MGILSLAHNILWLITMGILGVRCEVVQFIFVSSSCSLGDAWLSNANWLTNVATQEIGDKELLDRYHYICIVSDFILSSTYYVPMCTLFLFYSNLVNLPRSLGIFRHPMQVPFDPQTTNHQLLYEEELFRVLRHLHNPSSCASLGLTE